MGNLIEVYSKNNVPKNQRKCFFWFCFLKLFNVIHNTKKTNIYLLIQLLIKTKLNVNSQLRLRLSVVKVELKVGKNRINFSKNTFKLTNTVTKANIVIKDQEFYTFHFTDHIDVFFKTKQNKKNTWILLIKQSCLYWFQTFLGIKNLSVRQYLLFSCYFGHWASNTVHSKMFHWTNFRTCWILKSFWKGLKL